MLTSYLLTETLLKNATEYPAIMQILNITDDHIDLITEHAKYRLFGDSLRCAFITGCII